MFRLHETTRRRLCRTAFVLLCVAPPVAIGGWGALERLSRETTRCQRQLSEQLGLHATLVRVEHPRPGVTRYVGLELTDPETGQTVFRAKQAELTAPVAGAKIGQVVLVEPQFEAERLESLRQLLLRAVRREFSQRDVEWRVSAATVEVHTSTGPLSLVDASGGFTSAAMGSQAWIRFYPTGAEKTPRGSDQRVQVRLVRNRQGDLPYTGFALFTHGAELPCDPLLQLVGLDARLGAKSRFRGYAEDAGANEIPDVAVVCNEAGWDATVRGCFVDVDLRRLIGPKSPHQMDGRATLNVAYAKFERGRLAEAECSLVAGPGRVSRSLLTAAIEELGMRGAEPTAGTGLVSYEQLAARMELDRQGTLTITGDCDRRASGVVLSGSAPQPPLLLVEPKTQPQSVVGLVRMLSPSGDSLVPATQQAAGLLQWLPLPPGDKLLR